MASDEWQVARGRHRRAGLRKTPSGPSPRAAPGDDLTLEQLTTGHQRLCAAVDAEPSFAQLQRALTSLPAASSGPLDCVCLGLGSPSNTRCSRVQLALLHRLAEASPLLTRSAVSVGDPAFTPQDVEFLRRCFGPDAVMETNVEGLIACHRPALLFLPHCPLPLLNNLLFANWSPSCLGNVYLLGNRLGEALDSAAASGSDLSAVAFVKAASEMIQEVLIDWDGPLMSAMACTSLQWLHPLPPPASPLWQLKDAAPPNYSHADVGEMILAVPVTS